MLFCSMLFCVVSLGCACCWKYAGGPYMTMILSLCSGMFFWLLHPPNRAISAPNNIFIFFLISLPLTSRLYFPIQNLPKILFKTSCEVICPVISPRAERQSCRSMLRNSPLICIWSPSCTRWIASCARTNAS